jgi:hypothetical protein
VFEAGYMISNMPMLSKCKSYNAKAEARVSI